MGFFLWLALMLWLHGHMRLFSTPCEIILSFRDGPPYIWRKAENHHTPYKRKWRKYLSSNNKIYYSIKTNQHVICIRRCCGSKQPTRGRLRGFLMDQSFAATASRVRPAEPRPTVPSLRLRLRHPERRAEAEPRLPVASARAALFCCRVACLIARTE